MDQLGDLTKWLHALTQARVLVVGDVMLDRYVYGTVERISPEAPIPVLRVEREAAMLGGAGNVLRNLAALGVASRFLAVVGDDAAGREVAALIAAEPEVDNGLRVEPGRTTSIKERALAGSQQLLRLDRETLAPLAEETARALVAAAEAALPSAGAVVLSDYGKGTLSDAVLPALLAAARAHKVPLLVDPKGRDFARYRGAALVTPNRRELREASGLPVGSDAEIESACRALVERCGLGGVLATRSEQGLSLVTAEGAWHVPARARAVFDVSGAGDTVAAVAGAALAAGLAPEQAARLANLAAGVVVGKVGTAVARPEEIVAALQESELAQSEAKVAGLESLLGRVADWRRAGLKVGFTNGCFDLLHPGHVSLLRQARAACDRLIVGLNNDASVTRLKGEGRPVQPAAARATVLSSLADVDQVVVFAEDTPAALIEALRPDVLVKGADYALDQVVGADLVQAYGGRVLLVELEPGHSTSETIRRLTG